MKNLIKISAVLVIIFTSTLVYSNVSENPGSEKRSLSTNVTFNNVNKGARLLIKDGRGEILYTNSIESAGTWTRSFDFTTLPDAEYYFELDKNDEITILPFRVKSGATEILAEKQSHISKPKVYVRDNYVYISNKTKGEQSTTIELISEDNQEVYSEQLSDSNTVKRVYDFSSSLKGNYTFHIKSEGRVFSHQVKVGRLI